MWFTLGYLSLFLRVCSMGMGRKLYASAPFLYVLLPRILFCVLGYKSRFWLACSSAGLYSYMSRRGVEQFGSSPGS